MNNILQMQTWSVKGIKQSESMMREAKARIAVWQKRTKSLRAKQEPGMMIVICTLLFSKFDNDVRKDVRNAAGRDASSTDPETKLQNGTQRVMIDFEYMKSIVELVKRIDDQQKPSPMDLAVSAKCMTMPSTCLGMIKGPLSGQKIRVSGRPTAPKAKIGRGLRRHNASQPLQKQMPRIRTSLMP